MTKADSQVDKTALAGMADQEGQREHKEQEPYFDYIEQQRWDDLYRRRVDRKAHPVTELQRLAWEDCCTYIKAP